MATGRQAGRAGTPGRGVSGSASASRPTAFGPRGTYLRRGWFNLDLVSAATLLAAGLITRFSG